MIYPLHRVQHSMHNARMMYIKYTSFHRFRKAFVLLFKDPLGKSQPQMTSNNPTDLCALSRIAPHNTDVCRKINYI